MKNFYKHKGFTLIELMLVITIILILMGVLIPKVSAYQQKARNAKAVSAAKQIQTAAMSSYGNNDGNFNESDVTSTINELTSVEAINNVTVDGESINIGYKSDGRDCSVEINTGNNTCIVNCEGQQIFPRK
ncbi:type II secretion system protein [Clostridium sp. P21]|uniref:Type II secretion system protein n=1 Tax=Clostridium muellerianum TaxID=2716538 RepID=A0A7Y0HKZ0_9CLOT|nr:type II secretion system protein [Clostridium muellerianum]NMM61394.1 type II secretion system protein [Clostridium muellerianum]